MPYKRKKHDAPLWQDIDTRPIRTRCGKYVDTPNEIVTNDTPSSEICKLCRAYVEAAKRRRRYGK